jgi:ABC-2 type transport system ATP-binding protein
VPIEQSVISIRNLSKSYSGGDVRAVDGIDLEIFAGEIFALLGPNGAGKTTTVEILEGFRERDGGEVLVLEHDPAVKGVAGAKFRDRIGIVLQDSADGQDLSVLETLNHFRSYYSKPRAVSELLQAVGLEAKSNSRVRELSGGQRRRLDVALGILGSPELLFLDEPTTGFDPEARRSFWDLIRSLKASGVTIVLTTHYLDEAEALADRLAVISHGKIVEVATPKTLGGRENAKARVSWRDKSGNLVQQESENPTHFITELQREFDGEIPALTVTRPTLEDIYLEMIGERS